MKIVFTPRRKLRPKRTEITAVSASTVAQSRIHIIVYKGNNIPVRDEAWSLRYP